MVGKSIWIACRPLRLAAVLLLLGVTHPSDGLGAEERHPGVATENARVADARAPDVERALRGLSDLAPDDQQYNGSMSNGRWSRQEIEAWREKRRSAHDSAARSDDRTSDAPPAASPTANPVNVAPIQATRSPIRPAPATAATNGAGSQEWLRSPPKVLWLVWLLWLLVPAALLSVTYVLIRIIRVGATSSGRYAPPAKNVISRAMKVSRAELLPSPPARKEARDDAGLALRPVHPVAVNVPVFEEPTPRPAARVIVDFPPLRGIPQADPPTRDYQVLTIANNKGGIGKTTLAVNLAVYIRALREDLPILLISLDDQSLPDRMFGLDSDPPGGTVVSGMLEGSFASMIRMGQYGIEYVPSDPDVGALKPLIQSPLRLRSVLDQTGYKGLVIVDTKSDMEILTQNAIEASDLTIVPVADQESVLEAERVYRLLDQWQRPHERARIALTLIDLRVRYGEGSHHDMLSLLVSGIRERGFPLFECFVSRSPKIQSLHTNPNRLITPILHGAPASLIHRQMGQLTEEILGSLDAIATADASRKAPELREASNMG